MEAERTEENMTPLIYSFISAFSTCIGGFLPFSGTVKKFPQRYLLAFSAGIMLSVAFFGMLSEKEVGENILWAGLGFFGLYLVEKLTALHACHFEECEIHTLSPFSFIGVVIESLLDGVAIASSFHINSSLGFLVALGVVIHELPRGFSTTIISRVAGFSLKKTYLAVLLDGFLTPIGVLLSPFLLFLSLSKWVALTAGIFIYIGAADLIPEAHKKFNLKVVSSVMAGALLVLFLEKILKL